MRNACLQSTKSKIQSKFVTNDLDDQSTQKFSKITTHLPITRSNLIELKKQQQLQQQQQRTINSGNLLSNNVLISPCLSFEEYREQDFLDIGQYHDFVKCKSNNVIIDEDDVRDSGCFNLIGMQMDKIGCLGGGSYSSRIDNNNGNCLESSAMMEEEVIDNFKTDKSCMNKILQKTETSQYAYNCPQVTLQNPLQTTWIEIQDPYQELNNDDNNSNSHINAQKMCLELNSPMDTTNNDLLNDTNNQGMLLNNRAGSSHKALKVKEQNILLAKLQNQRLELQKKDDLANTSSGKKKEVDSTKGNIKFGNYNISNDKSIQSTCSTNSERLTVTVKLFDPQLEPYYCSEEDYTPHQNPESTTKKPPQLKKNPIAPGFNDLICKVSMNENYDEDNDDENEENDKDDEENNNIDCEEIIKPLGLDQILPIEEIKSNNMSNIPTPEEEIILFEKIMHTYDIYIDIFQNMMDNEQDYTPDPFYFKFKQRELNPFMRATLFDWMMEVSAEFFLKRETLHTAINYVDRYLSNVVNIQKWELQLIGLAAMVLSSKMEEVYPHRVVDFARSADFGYTTQQILEMEIKLAKTLKWKLTPATIFTWVNWYMVEWDNFLDSSQVILEARLINNNNPNNELIHFKLANRDSYTKYIELLQMIDCAILNSETLKYKNRALVASFLYLLIGKYYKQFNVNEIIHEIPVSSYFLYNDTQGLNYIFSYFLRFSFGYQLEDLLPTIQYVANYFSINISYDLPLAAKTNPDKVLKGHYEEFLCYQTYYPSNLEFIKAVSRRK